jgi:hypothetical protein
LFRWKQRKVFHDRYRLDDHPALDHGASPRAVTVHSSDYIYANDDFDASPIVLEAPYNLVFFPVYGAGDTVWRCLIRRLLGYEDWDDTARQFDGLRYLSNYTTEQASEIMSSPNYTRAMFVRNPLERIQSVYMQMVEHDPSHDMIRGCDCARGCGGGDILDRCINYTSSFRDFLTELVPTCEHPYWRPQAHRMEPKYFPLLDFTGRYETFADDAQALLQRLIRNHTHDDDHQESSLDWTTRQTELNSMMDRLDVSYSKHDYESRFELAWGGPFLHEYRSEQKNGLVSRYRLGIDRLKAKSYHRKKRKIQWFGEELPS